MKTTVAIKYHQDASQETTSNVNNNLWTAESQQNSELFIFQENIGLK